MNWYLQNKEVKQCYKLPTHQLESVKATLNQGVVNKSPLSKNEAEDLILYHADFPFKAVLLELELEYISDPTLLYFQVTIVETLVR